MRVFKFGGASVKDAESLKNVGNIIKNQSDNNLLIVVSAMGKMTNAFEALVHAYTQNSLDFDEKLLYIRNYHQQIIANAFADTNDVVMEVEMLYAQIGHFFSNNRQNNFDYIYDQIVIYGELISTKIVSAYLKNIGIDNIWLDARHLVKTDFQYRSANVDWISTSQSIQNAVSQSKIYLTQGFIGSASADTFTTLGREGSDYSAAIFAYCLHAESMTIWKDVAGVLNADPRYFEDTCLLQQMSYREALEMAFYGATVIHPKTIKPLENKNIALNVKSFLHPNEQGTIITKNAELIPNTACYTYKDNQILLSISSKDFSFMIEHNISHLFQLFTEYRVKVNLIQNSAISFSVCIEDMYHMFNFLIEKLSIDYNVKYNLNVKLISIRHYTPTILDKIEKDNQVLLIQQSQNTAQIIIQ